jgi:hypothetical protein
MIVSEVIQKLNNLGPLFKDAKVMFWDGNAYQEVRLIVSVSVTPVKPAKPVEGFVAINELKPDDKIGAVIA